MTLDKKLTRLRKKAGLSQAEVSEELDVSRQAGTKWETGQSRPSTENLQSLSKLYNVPIEYLLDDSKDKPPSVEDRSKLGEQSKGKLWIRWLVIGAVVLALLVGCFFWYESQQNKTSLDLHSIQGEDGTTQGEPDFSMTWE